jgi:GntR family transcriptional regulator
VILLIDPDGDVPLYQQIRDRVVEAIASGDLHEGDPLPATRALAADLGINFHTVNKGYGTLREERLIRLTRRSGAVVTRDPGTGPPEAGFLDDWDDRARTLLAEARAHGVPPEEIIARCERMVYS